jgi:phosphate transport system substrate-binding protein
VVRSFATILLLTVLAVGGSEELPSYEPREFLLPEDTAGRIASRADCMNGLLALWAEAFREHHPGVRFHLEGKGSYTFPWTNDLRQSTLVPLARAPTRAELDWCKEELSREPLCCLVALDAVAVFVHEDNPIRSLRLDQLDAVFSKTRKRGRKSDIRYWADLGLEGAWQRRPIRVYGHNSAADTHHLFRRVVLDGGDFKDEVREQPGSYGIVSLVSVDLSGIGYTTRAYARKGVRAVAVEGVAPETAAVRSGRYPLVRRLHLCTDRDPRKPLAPFKREFYRLVLSREGQAIVARDGYVPLEPEAVRRGLRTLDG